MLLVLNVTLDDKLAEKLQKLAEKSKINIGGVAEILIKNGLNSMYSERPIKPVVEPIYFGLNEDSSEEFYTEEKNSIEEVVEDLKEHIEETEDDDYTYLVVQKIATVNFELKQVAVPEMTIL